MVFISEGSAKAIDKGGKDCMKRRFYCTEQEDWNDYVMKNVSKKYYDINKIICLVLNIVVPAALLLVFKLNFAEYIFAFLVFDVALVLIEYLSIGLYKSSASIKWAIKKSRWAKDVSKMSAEDIAKLRAEMNQNTEFYKEKMEILERQIQEYKEAAIAPKDKEGIKYVEEVIKKFSMYMMDVEEAFIQKSLEKIITASHKLLDAIKNDPDDGIRVVSLFKVYSDELLKILGQYENLDEDAKQEKMPKVKNLLKVFLEKLEELQERISSGNERNFDTDIDYLTKKLEEGS